MHGAILLAAGSGSRMDGFVKDKILANIQEATLFDYLFKHFQMSLLFAQSSLFFGMKNKELNLCARLNISKMQNVRESTLGKRRRAKKIPSKWSFSSTGSL